MEVSNVHFEIDVEESLEIIGECSSGKSQSTYLLIGLLGNHGYILAQQI